MRSHAWALLFTAACFSAPAWGQSRAGENATRTADDAFGVAVGNDRIGLYNERDARGFSPLAAGNVRIEGLYYDMRGIIPSRVLASTAIRVGLAAQNYPFPAPTGIADYTLRAVQYKNTFSNVIVLGPNAGYSIEFDGQRVIVPDKFGVAFGMWSRKDDQVPGDSNGSMGSYAIVPRWKPYDGAEVTAFLTYGGILEDKFNPLVFTSGPFLPPDIYAKFFGQDWSLANTYFLSYGSFAKLPMGDHWTLNAGVFRHNTHTDGLVADLYLNTDQAGLPATHTVTKEWPQKNPSVSGEARLTGVFQGENLRQTVHVMTRGRTFERFFGGSARANLTPVPVGEPIFIPEPDWTYGVKSVDAVQQWAVGAQYQLAWRKLGEVSIGVQQVDYKKEIRSLSGAPAMKTTDKPTFVNSAVAVNVTPKLVAYASFAQGLEEAPIAPENALNANEAPPAIHTEQHDFGIRYRIAPRLNFILGYFDIEKPYFNVDAGRVYRNLGDETHKGYEISLAGPVTGRLNLVLGAVLQKPEVSGEAVQAGLIGPKPVSQAETTLRLNLDYRTPWIEGLSVDAAWVYVGERAATSRTFTELGGKQLNVKDYQTLDLGMRYRFKIGTHRSTLRAQVFNVFDTFTWKVYPSGGLYVTNPRNFGMSLATDF
ncbi:MAG: hypothetical protein AB7G04_06970 [Hyphomonadaceae bacterium]